MGVSVWTLRAAARRIGLPVKKTIRGPVYDLTEGQVEKLKAGLHGKRGRPPRREAL